MMLRHWMNDYPDTRRLISQPQRHGNSDSYDLKCWFVWVWTELFTPVEENNWGYLTRDIWGYVCQETTLMFFPSVTYTRQ